MLNYNIANLARTGANQRAERMATGTATLALPPRSLDWGARAAFVTLTCAAQRR